MTASCEDRINQELENTMNSFEHMAKMIDAGDWDKLDQDTIEFIEDYMGHYAEGDFDEHLSQIIDEYGISFALEQNYHGVPFEYADELEVYTEEYGYGLVEACESLGYAPLHWQFSWGGPSDGLVITLIKERWGWDVVNAHYYFQDWFDGAWRELSPKQLGIVRKVVQTMCVECLFL
jgi:hypothetical protein